RPAFEPRLNRAGLCAWRNTPCGIAAQRRAAPVENAGQTTGSILTFRSTPVCESPPSGRREKSGTVQARSAWMAGEQGEGSAEMSRPRKMTRKGGFAPALLSAACLALAIPSAGLALVGLDGEDAAAAPIPSQFAPFTPASVDPQLARRVAQQVAARGQT